MKHFKKKVCKLVGFIFSILLIFTFTGCNLLNNENIIRTIPKQKNNSFGIEGINFLCKGYICDVSSDGKKLLFYTDNQKDSNYSKDLYFMDLEDGSCNKMFWGNGVLNYTGKISPDGRKVAVSPLSRAGGGKSPFFIWDTVTGKFEEAKIEGFGKVMEGAGVSWSHQMGGLLVAGWDGKNDKFFTFDNNGEQKESIITNQYTMEDLKEVELDLTKCIQYYDDCVVYVEGENIVLKKFKISDLTDEGTEDIKGKTKANGIDNGQIGEKSVTKEKNKGINDEKINLATKEWTYSKTDLLKGDSFLISPDGKYIAFTNKIQGGKYKIKVDYLNENFTPLYTVAEFDLISSKPVYTWSGDSKYLTCFNEGSIWNLNMETKEYTKVVTNMGRVFNIKWTGNDGFIFETLFDENDLTNSIYYTGIKGFKNLDFNIFKDIYTKDNGKEHESGFLKNQSLVKNISASSSTYGYNPDNIIDGSLSTAWVEGSSDHGGGEDVEIELNNVALSMIGIINGYRKNEYVYYANNRVKKLKVKVETVIKNLKTGALNDGGIFAKTVELKDEDYYKNPLNPIDLVLHHSDFEKTGEDEIRLANKLKLEILDVWPGTNYNDTCISEVIIWGDSIK